MLEARRYSPTNTNRHEGRNGERDHSLGTNVSTLFSHRALHKQNHEHKRKRQGGEDPKAVENSAAAH
jgi:hypothetical protein